MEKLGAGVSYPASSEPRSHDLSQLLRHPKPQLPPPLLHFLFLVMVPAIAHNPLLHARFSIWGPKLNSHGKMMRKGDAL